MLLFVLLLSKPSSRTDDPAIGVLSVRVMRTIYRQMLRIDFDSNNRVIPVASHLCTPVVKLQRGSFAARAVYQLLDLIYTLRFFYSGYVELCIYNISHFSELRLIKDVNLVCFRHKVVRLEECSPPGASRWCSDGNIPFLAQASGISMQQQCFCTLVACMRACVQCIVY